MIIREVEKTHAPRKNKEINPLRKSAQGLGVLLKGLSETVQSAKKRKNGDADTLETPYAGASRTFKLSNAIDESEQAPPLPFKLNFSEEQTEVLALLKEARKLAADASSSGLAVNERETFTARFQTIFKELSVKFPQTFAALQTAEKDENNAQLSVSTHGAAAGAFLNIEDMIVKIFETGARQQSKQSTGQSAAAHSDPNTALSASGQIRELFLTEGAAKTFGRFQEIDRNNVLGLLK